MKWKYQFTPALAMQLEGRVVLSRATLGLSTVVSGLAPHLQVLNRKQRALVAEVNQAFNSFQSDFDQARATYFAALQITPTSSASASATATPAAASPSVADAAAALVNAATASSASASSIASIDAAASALVDAAAASASSATASSAAPSAATVDAATTAFQSYTVQRTLLLSQQLISSFVQTPQGTARAPGQPNAVKVLIESKIIGPKGKGPAGSLISSLDQTTAEIDSSMLSSSPTTTLYTLSQDNSIAASRTAVLNGVSIIKSGAFGIQKTNHY
jgi:hypothetical protein